VYWWAVALFAPLVGPALIGHHVLLACVLGGLLLIVAGAMLGYLRRQGQASTHQPPGTDAATTSTGPELGQLTTDPGSGELDTTGLLGPGHWRAISHRQPRYRQATADRHDQAADE
jgi:hypothetical protein